MIADGPCLDPKVTTSSYEELVNHLFSRIDTGSGPYQMVAVLGDGVAFKCPTTTTTPTTDGGGGGGGGGDSSGRRRLNGEYYEEVPVEYFNQRFDALPRLVWHFGYAEQRQRLHETMEGGTLFQVSPSSKITTNILVNASPSHDHVIFIETVLSLALPLD